MAVIVGLFDRYEEAERATNALLTRGFLKEEIGIITDDRAVQEYRKQRQVTAAQVETGTGMNGGVLITVRADGERVDEAQEILGAAHAVDVEGRPDEWPRSVPLAETAETRPKTEPEQLERPPASERPQPDPLTAIEVDKGGT